MKSKILRALAAVAIIGTLLAAGTAPYGPPGVRYVNVSSILGQ